MAGMTYSQNQGTGDSMKILQILLSVLMQIHA